MNNGLQERSGKLQRWNDDRGFGFIHPDDGGLPVFMHISVMRGEERPQPGESLRFRAEQTEDGRWRATHVRRAALELDSASIRKRPRPAAGAGGEQSAVPKKARKQTAESRQPRADADERRGRRARGLWGLHSSGLDIKLLLWLMLCLPLLLGAFTLQQRQPQLWWLILLYPLASLLTVFFYMHDKRQALDDGWRVPENTLHLLELFGGWPGALIAQQLFRHKTRKASFLFVLWSIILLHEAFWLDYLLLRGMGLRRLLLLVGI